MNHLPVVMEPRDVTPAGHRRVTHRLRAAARQERARVRREERGPVNIGLWLPSTVIFALLAPFAMLLLPFLYLAPRDVIARPARTLVGVGHVLLSLGGAVVEVDAPDCHIRLRFF